MKVKEPGNAGSRGVAPQNSAGHHRPHVGPRPDPRRALKVGLGGVNHSRRSRLPLPVYVEQGSDRGLPKGGPRSEPAGFLISKPALRTVKASCLYMWRALLAAL